MTPKTNPTEYLNNFAVRLEEAESLAKKEADAIQAEIRSHEAAIQNYAENGTGLLDATHARAALDAFDKTIFGEGRRASSALAKSEREAFLASHAQTQAGFAKEKLVRAHATELADALSAIIAGRSKNREAWRESIVDAALALDRRVRLESLVEHEILVLNDKAQKLDARLAAADTIFAEANRHVAKLRVSPDLQTFHDAHAFAMQVSYE